jgi:WD40 repeat protein
LPSLQVISLQNASKVRLLRTLQIPGYQMSSVSQCSLDFSPDGSLLAGVCGISPAPVWEMHSAQLLYTLLDEASHEVAVSFSPTGDVLAVGGFSGEVRLFDPSSGKPTRVLPGLPSQVWDLDFSPSADQLAIATFASGVFLESFPGGQPLWNQSEKGQLHALSVDLSGDGTILAYGAVMSGVRVLDTTSGEMIATLNIPAPVGDVAFSPDGLLLASGSDDNKVRLWNTSDYSLRQELAGHSSYVNGVAFTPDGSLLVTGSKDTRLGLWDVAAGKLIQLLGDHTSAVLRVAVNPQGTLIASISWDGTVRLWGVEGE